MPIPITLDVLARLILRKSLPGIIEMEEFMLVILVFLGLAYIQAEKEHIRIELLVSRFPQWLQTVIDGFIYLASTILFAIISWQTYLQAIKKIGTKSTALGIPISIFLVIAAVGTLLLTLIVATDFLKIAKKIIKDGKWLYLLVILALGVLIILLPFYIKTLPFRISGLSLGSLGALFLFLLMLLGMPIGFAMALAGYLGLLMATRNAVAAFSMLGIAPYFSTASFILAVAPLFILMGELALYAGISDELFEAAYKWLGRLPGGLAMAAVAGCAGFAAVCGDSMSTAVTMGTVALPEMKKRKYHPGLATGCLAAGGTLGILIPPSIGFIFYAIITEESIGKLFIAGIIPGIILASMYIGCIYIIARRNPALAPPGEVFSLKEKLVSLKGISSMLILFLIIMGGILSGSFSSTEGGAIGAMGAFIIGIVRRRLSWEGIVTSIKDTAKITIKLFMILIGVGILGYFLAATRLPHLLANVVTGLPFNRYFIFTAMCIIYIILGCLMNVIPMILLTLPAIYPAIFAMGFDPVWFGVVIVILMEMGQITPPVGVNVYAINSVSPDVPMETTFKGILPFFICMVICIIILVLFPQLATFLPALLFK
nr:TRAP transporter large permease subunit [Moorella sulfitireducens]